MSCLYSPYKSIGYVSDGNPFFIHRLGEESFIYTTIGKTFQIYRFDKLLVCLVSLPIPDSDAIPNHCTIQSIQATGHKTYIAVHHSIYVYDRSHITDIIKNHHNSKILHIMLIGNILISHDGNNIKVYDIKMKETINAIESIQTSVITSWCHPSTYVNKILLGYQNGCIELWNIIKQKIVYTFKSHLKYSSGEVKCIEQSPALDVVGLGFETGDILLLNLKLDVILFNFKQENGFPTSLSFRTDIGAEKYPYMASGSSDGRIHIWNLGKPSSNNTNNDSDEEEYDNKTIKLIRKLEESINDAHMNSVSKVYFLYGEPILISNSSDNSLKVWIFDNQVINKSLEDNSNTQCKVRLLRSRQGHQGPSYKIKYYGGTINGSLANNNDATSCSLLSCGLAHDNTFRYFNTAIEQQSRELSQKPILKKLNYTRRNEKLPNIMDFDSCESRQNEWGNVITIHKNHANAYVWKYKDKVITEMILHQSKTKDWSNNPSNYCTSVCISSCGNFGIIGSRNGIIYQYNLQSGQARGTFPSNITQLLKSSRDEQNELLEKYKKKSKTPGNVIHEAIKILHDGDSHDAINPYIKQLVKSEDQVVQHISNESKALSSIVEYHTNEVSGLFTDMSNLVLVSCSLDGSIIFWDFLTHKVLHIVQVKVSQLMLRGFRDGGYVAFVGQDRVIRVYDLYSFKLSRRFSGHSREVNDICFTPDGRRLLSCSSDKTIRTWDMPTGKCVSWISFDHAVLSIAISHSSEFLCVSQADVNGISMYVDRSCYETVHFWKEPEKPTPIGSTFVRTEMDEDDTDKDDEEDHLEEEFDMDEAIESFQDDLIHDTLKPKESTIQRGEGVITLAALPKAYWVTLFHLEAIKTRNKQLEHAMEKQKDVPFFLPTVIRNGAQPSFPTPQEYLKMTASFSETNNSIAINSTTTNKTLAIDSKETEVDVVDLKFASAWEDDDEADANANANANANDVSGNSQDEEVQYEDIVKVSGKALNTSLNSVSRIIRRNVILPRCTLVAYILQDYPHCVEGDFVYSKSNNATLGSSAILSYLKTISPSAIDVEMTSLCTHVDDELGIQYLHAMINMFLIELPSGNNFEALQAYLHRFLKIYGEILVKIPLLQRLVLELETIHEQCCNRFRNLLQKNLCLMKVLANLPNL